MAESEALRQARRWLVVGRAGKPISPQPEEAASVLAALERIPELEARNQRLQQTLVLHENPGKVVVTAETWERAERVETALVELARRASDPDIEATAVGARIMLDEALKDAAAALDAAPAPTVAATAYHAPLTEAFREREKVDEQPESDFEPDDAPTQGRGEGR